MTPDPVPAPRPPDRSVHRPAVAVTDRRGLLAPDGTQLSVIVATPPPGVPLAPVPAVLAVHGFASSAFGNWQRTGHLDTLIRAGRTVVAPDLRGHGLSDRPHRTSAYRPTTMLADLVTVAECVVTDAATGNEVAGVAVTESPGRPLPQQIDLLGYSLGARLCWMLACQHLLPVRRMVLGGFDGRALFQGVDTEALEKLAEGGRNNDRVALRHLVAGLAGTGGTPPGGALPEVPTLLVAGDRDPLASRAADLAARLPHGRFLPVPGRTHISAVPASTFRTGVRDFLAG